MSSKVMITYKRKRVTSRRDVTDKTVHEPSSAAASNTIVANSLPSKYEADAENSVKDEDNFPTSTKQHDVCISGHENINGILVSQSTNKTEKGEKKHQLCESLLQKKQPKICFAPNNSTAEAQSYKLSCTDDTNSLIPVSRSVCDSLDIDGMTNRIEDSKASAPLEINYHQVPKIPVRSDQCKNRFSPLLTFHRRVKKKKSSDEAVMENCSRDNKQCSTLTCSLLSSSPDVTNLLNHTGGESSEIEPKETVVGMCGLPIQAQQLHKQESLCVVKSLVQHISPSEVAEVVNQLEHTGTPVSKSTAMLEVSEKDARMGKLSKTSPDTIEVPKVIDVQGKGHANLQSSSLESPRQEINVTWLKPTNKYVTDLLESQGSTKNVPVIVLDDDNNDDKGKELENSAIRNQGVQNKNKRRFSLGKIDLNCSELRQEERPLRLDGSSIQWLQDQGQFGNAHQNQMSQPFERMFFPNEKDTMHSKQQQHEGSSAIPTLYSNWFDQTPCWNAGNFETPSLPSELKFRIMDKVPEFSLDLSLDSFPDSSMASRRGSNLFPGGNLGMSHKLTEKLGTYSKRRSAPWSEEELDFLWIGVRRYGVNNWNAMLRDTRLHFSNSRMPDDLAKQWDKEQKNLLGADFLQSIRTPGLVPAEDYRGKGSCSGCSKSLFLAAQTDLSLGDVYLQNARGPGRGVNHMSSLDMLNLHGIDSAPRNLSLGGFPGASSSYGRSSGRRRRASKFHKSHYDKASWFREPSGRLPQLLPVINQQPMKNGLPQWLTQDAKTGTNRVNQEMWPGLVPPPGHSTANPLGDSLRGASLFADDMKSHVLPDASLKHTMRRNTDWRSFSKRLFQTSDALDLNQGSAVIAAPNGATASDTGASSEETVSDS